VARLDATGAIAARFVYGTGLAPDYLVQGGQTYVLITDHLGSVRLVGHATTGAIVQRIDYDEFGQVLVDSAPGFQPIGYAGGLYDPDSGLVEFNAREYDRAPAASPPSSLSASPTAATDTSMPAPTPSTTWTRPALPGRTGPSGITSTRSATAPPASATPSRSGQRAGSGRRSMWTTS
jgi:hypothetical protein